ncbi:hypothetical protein ACFRIC_12260 [Streptomyces sp. NPDC056738]|uniref:hypothetical protein n=1 Tax=Streptomyces sp. NPDC056738 TaxID=3345933 RepID=UPI0036B1F226
MRTKHPGQRPGDSKEPPGLRHARLRRHRTGPVELPALEGIAVATVPVGASVPVPVPMSAPVPVPIPAPAPRLWLWLWLQISMTMDVYTHVVGSDERDAVVLLAELLEDPLIG